MYASKSGIIGVRAGERSTLSREAGVARQAEDLAELAGSGIGLVLEEGRVLFLHQVPEKGFGVLLVENGEIPGQPHRFAVDAQNPVSDVVEGSAPESPRGHPRQILDAVQHLAGRLVGERQKEDFLGRNALREKVRYAVGERARFAGPGAGEDEGRAGFGRDGFVLLVVELAPEIDGRHFARKRFGQMGTHKTTDILLCRRSDAAGPLARII